MTDQTRQQRLDQFMAVLNSKGEDGAIDTYGTPEYWDQCKHGQWFCRHGGRDHKASVCIHEDAPQYECTSPTVQLGLFGGAR